MWSDSEILEFGPADFMTWNLLSNRSYPAKEMGKLYLCSWKTLLMEPSRRYSDTKNCSNLVGVDCFLGTCGYYINYKKTSELSEVIAAINYLYRQTRWWGTLNQIQQVEPDSSMKLEDRVSRWWLNLVRLLWCCQYDGQYLGCQIWQTKHMRRVWRVLQRSELTSFFFAI